MKRLFDIVLSISLLIVCSPLITVLVLVIRGTSSGPGIYWSERIGKGGRVFRMPKLRTMDLDTPSVATNELSNPEKWLTSTGRFLRKSSLDELPQLWSILKGDMSFVGPRPVLVTETDLIEARRAFGLERLVPGLTGLAQINGRDHLSIKDKVSFDLDYMRRQTLLLDISIVMITAYRVLRRDGVRH